MARKNSESAPRTLQKRDLERRAFQLRMTGLSFDEIAVQLGYAGRGAAYKAFKRHLDRYQKEVPEEVEGRLALAEGRLDRMLATWMPRAVGRVPTGEKDSQGRELFHPPDVDAAKMVIHIERRRARLRGLDAPERVNLAGHDGGKLELNNAADAVVTALDKIIAGYAAADGADPGDREGAATAA